MDVINHVPPLDLKRQYEPLSKQILETFERIFNSGGFILGPDVTSLEKELAQFLGVSHTIGVTSGTDALWLALKAVGIKPGDHVLTSPFTFFATVSAICNAGAIPVFADIDPDTFNICPEKIKQALKQDTNKKIKAIIPVHLYGQAAEMNAILSLAEQHNLFVIEDACQAIGTRHDKGVVGSLGHLGAFSMFPTKNLGAFGDAGFVSVNNSSLAEKVTLLRTHGSTVRYHHEIVGSNCRIDTIQAALLRVLLPQLNSWIQLRQEAASYYDERLKELSSKIESPKRAPYSTHTFHQYTIRVHNGGRDSLSKFLTESKIGNSIYYPIPCHLQKALSHLNFKTGDFPIAEKAASEVLSIPIFPGILRQEQDYIVDTIARWTRSH
ncbi:MAG: DegT/DnrJ/EryC1/StrS family aminotransferase [Proteobacteria bacterium]|nr:DegT/DnrJ/EryC1/StrS family aminotransferase [Pseudomonadota bacterium]